MLLIPMGVAWVGYTLLSYGLALIKGPGTGLADLVYPSRISKFGNANVPGGVNTNNAQALASMQPPTAQTPPTPSPLMLSGSAINYQSALASMRPPSG